MEKLRIKRAILSVTDKSGLVEFASYLAQNGVELVSTGGTRKALAAAGLAVTAVSEVTGFPEILGGRVKTLHPKIHAGILASKDDPLHLRTLADLDIKPFDLVCVNLYNFSLAAERGLPASEAVELIDIGGPCLLRAAAKNFHSVLVAPSPAFYPAIIEELGKNGMAVGLGFRHEMAVETFRATSSYDAMIAEYLQAGEIGHEVFMPRKEK